MSKQHLRWGILGVAKINDRIIPSFAKATRSKLAAIASRDLGRAQAAAARADIPTAHGSYEALLADPDIDAVYIPLPNHLHAEWTRKAADAGKHILCEKPLTPDADSAAALVAYCESKSVKLMEGFMWPHHPRTAKLREIIDRGDIGRVERVSASFTFPLSLDPANIRLRPETAGGSLLDVGCYPIFGIRWAFGAEIASAQAVAKYRNGVDVEMSGVVETADGRLATFDCGFTAPNRQGVEITGTDGVIRVPKMWVPDADAAFTVEFGDRSPENVYVRGHDQVACMLDDLSRAVLEGTPVKPDPSEAVKTLRVLDLIAKGVYDMVCSQAARR